MYDMVFESNIFERNLQNNWQGRKIFVYTNDGISRDRFYLTEEEPSVPPLAMRLLAAQTVEEE